MTRFVAHSTILAIALIAVAPAVAATPFFSATPVTAPTTSSLITRNTMWHCSGGVCTATKASGSNATMCELVVKQVGPLSAFSARGETMDGEALAKCNARAK